MSKWSDLRDIAQTGAKLEEKRSMALQLAVAGDDGPALHSLFELLAPLTPRAKVDKIVAGAGTSGVGDGVELVIIALEQVSAALADLIEHAKHRRLTILAVRPSLHTGMARPSDDALRRIGIPIAVDLDFQSGRLSDEFFKQLLVALPAKKLALCANFDGARAHAARQAVGHTAWQNGVIAGVVFIPGADMPILTGNQIKMVLELAAIYGKEMTFERAKELIAVVGAGFTLRTVARELLDFLPGPGWPVKAAIAYGGTLAMGRAAEQYLLHADEWQATARQGLTALRERASAAGLGSSREAGSQSEAPEIAPSDR